jgi:FAD/FMN-containing dehydrogenase/Fe-S oxidoreductase
MLDFRAEKLAHLLGYLRKHVDGEIRFDATSRRLYSTDASIYQITPTGVVIPRTEQALLSAVQICLETRTPIVARGGGTSLSGQSIGAGVVIDCSKYLNAIGPVDAGGRTVRVQPGVVLDHLNRHLAPHGLQFGPEVATFTRATLGGMIGNNSAGARSIVFGMTEHHVRSLSMILSDGRLTEFRNLTAVDWDRKTGPQTQEGEAYRTIERVLVENRDEIDRRFPKIIRRVSGYNLADCGTPRRRHSLIPILVGSEGTLGFSTSAELALVPRPKHRALLVPHFMSLRSALDAVAACLEFDPSAVELVDSLLITLARKQRSLRNTMAAVEGNPEALLMVEFHGDDEADVRSRVFKLKDRLSEVPGLTVAIPAIDPALRDPMWNMRSAATPLVYGIPGDRKPIAFVEDCAVDPARMPEFATRFRELLLRHGTDGAFYGHASVGCLHIRPMLDLKETAEVTRMRRITEEVVELTREFGGSLSGEHGDGLARSEWNRVMFGEQVYEAFRQVKRAFDPENLFNPGKIVDAPAMTDNLRLGSHYQPTELPLVFDYQRQGNFFQSIELCNGAGVCRKTQGGAMCPSYRATRDEQDTTRARANALRLAISGQGERGNARSPLAERWIQPVMDLCLSCKACKAECPSNVDVAKLKAEWQAAYYAEHRRPLGHKLLARAHRLNRVGSFVAPIANWMNRRRPARWIMEWMTGIDRHRPLPEFQWTHVRRWFRKRPRTGKQDRGRVILFDDCFTTFNEPNAGIATVEVLERAGYAVELANPICCGRALISKGYLKEARELARDQLPDLAKRVADGTPIVGLEPSCVLTLADEWPELVPGPEANVVAAAVRLADDWLAERLSVGDVELPLRPSAKECVFHGHCHQKALVGINGSAALLQRVPGLRVTALDAGCCGMAGAFGYEKEHYEVSVKIAGLQLLPALAAAPDAMIAATGTSCRHQIRDLTGRQARHPMEVIRAAIDD